MNPFTSSLFFIALAATSSRANQCPDGSLLIEHPSCAGTGDPACSGTCSLETLLEDYFCCPKQHVAKAEPSDNLTITSEAIVTSTTTATTKKPDVPAGSACRDTIPNCSQHASYCQRGAYRAMLRSQCAKTCKFCTPTRSCADAKDSRVCSTAFCSSSVYSEATKKAYCAKTCNKC